MSLLDLLFPPRCAGCGRYGANWCTRCADAIEPIPEGILNGISLVAGGRFAGPLQRAIHTYKYEGRRQLAADLAPLLAQAASRSGIRITALAAIPLHPQRLNERGFNQAERLARALGMALHLPLVGGLTRIVATPAQVGLRQAERRVNLAGAFAWTGTQAPPRGLALVDDVCTTGATLEAAAQAIQEAGGSIGAFLVLARAQTLPAPAVTSPDRFACP